MQIPRTRALVLLVDDSPTQGQRSAQALEAAGFRVRLATDGREALEQARHWRPDVIVSDVLMPVMDGFALCRELRRDPALAHLPVVLHTMTYLDPRDEEFALGLGATRFVLKPTDPSQLVAEVRAVLSAGHLPDAHPAAVDDAAFLTAYSQRLAAKLEDKVAELEEAYHRLELEGRRNELILAAAGEGIFGLDTQGKTTFVNPAAARLLGYAAEDLLGQPMHDLVHYSRSDGAPYPRRACPAHAVLTDGTPCRVDDEVFWRKDGTSFPVEYVCTPVRDGGLIVGAVVTFMDVTERRRAQASLQYQAWHDLLTGLPNRTRLCAELDRLTSTERTGEPFALLLLDLDRFKEVNDTIGHSCGDRLLQQIGVRCRTELHELDTLARLGGDEFAVLLPGADTHRACAVADRLLDALEQVFELDGLALELGGSIGIALYPEHGADADTLLRHADVAMYAAKDARSGYAIYAPDADRYTPERLRLLAELRSAIERGELMLYYQPQVDVRSGALTAVEALVRWPHPVRGLLPPDEFIPLAEQTRLIRPLSRWVLEAALRQCAAWCAAGLDVPVAVNMSAQDLQDPALPAFVSHVLGSCGLGPDRLRIEITESGLMADPRRAREILVGLRTHGVQIAIDDFGTGYSSLAYLQRLAVDELKIDMSFVRQMAAEESARAIVRAVIDLADDLGLRVVAEGVEDQATWQALAALGCDVAQGYYFAPPLPATELRRWAEGVSDWRLDELERRRLESTLAERASERGTRLAAEEEFVARKHAEWALRQSEERLRLALDAAGVAIWEWDVVQHTVNWSEDAPRLLGVDVGAERTAAGMLELVHPDDREVVKGAFATALGEDRDLRLEYRILRPDGSTVWIGCRGRLVRDPAGRPLRILGTIKDITERKTAEQQRLALAQAEKLRALGQMASGVAHDLNQSLGLIAGYSDLAQRAVREAPIDVEALGEALPIIAQAALNGGQTVRRLLTFARSRPDGEAERVQLADIIREVVQLTAPRWRDNTQAAGRPVSLHVETAGDTSIVGWPVGLGEAVTNLIFNAVDALPTGGVIRLCARRCAEDVVVEVADSGVGMSPEVQARIFEPFFTTKGERGTGLGLPQVFGVVAQHRGSIAVESAPGRGTTFRLVFPVAQQAPEAAERAPQTTAAAGRPLRVLAVDDEPTVGKMVARILRPGGHQVVTATSGEEALEHLSAQPFDVVISDVGMGPGMNGWELVERVRGAWPQVRVILATGWGAIIDPAEARARGVDVVVAKPYQPAELERALAA